MRCCFVLTHLSRFGRTSSCLVVDPLLLDDATSVLASLMNGEPLPTLDEEDGLLPIGLAMVLACLSAMTAGWLPAKFGMHARATAAAILAAMVAYALSSNATVAVTAAVTVAFLALVSFHIRSLDAALVLDPLRKNSKTGWNPDEFTFDPNDPEAARRRIARAGAERDAPGTDRDDHDWSGGNSGRGSSRGGGASGGW